MDVFIRTLFLINLYILCVAGNEWTSTSFPFETSDDEISSLSPEDSLATELTTPATASSWDEDSYQEYFHRHYNQTFIDASGVDLPKPSTISESTLRGFSRFGFLDGVLFPKSFKNMVEPLKTFLNLLLRLPIIIAGLIVGENAELLGLQAMQVGNAFLLMGAQGFGYTLKEYAIGFIAFGKTVKEWFVTNNLPSFDGNSTADESLLTQHSGEAPSYGYYWDKLGSSYLQTRLEVEEMYGNHF